MTKPKFRRKLIESSSSDEEIDYDNEPNGVQVLNNIISLNRRPITILVPNEHIKQETNGTSSPNRKIPRPANAFMIFANENRKKVAKINPQESNKEISCRLGTQWKNLSTEEKEKYFTMAKALDADHKRKYPDYVYNPKEARIRKAMRERERSMGAAQMGSQRARRTSWPKQSGHMPPTHQEHLMGTPSKELCSAIRAEVEHGFLAGNGGYVYPSQQYQFSPQSDYSTYIQVSPSNWVPNGYNIQGNAMVQQQIWNQYQTERLRAQQSQGPTYLINSQGQNDYQHMDHIVPNSMMPMGPTTKPNIHQNLENAANDVDRYLNIPSTMNSNPTVNNIEASTPISEPIRTIANVNVSNPTVASSSTMVDAAAPEATNVTNNDNLTDVNNGVGAINEMVNVSNMQEGSSSNEMNISSVTSMSEVDAQLNMENAGSNSESSFGTISLFEEHNLQAMTSQEHNKTVSTSTEKNSKCSIPPAHLNFRKPEHPEPLLNPYFPTFIPTNNYIMEYINPEFACTFPDNKSVTRTDFPVDFSSQRYFDSIANGNFEGMNGDHFSNFVCDDGYSFMTFTNPQDNHNSCILPTNQFEVNQFLSDPCAMRSINNDSSCILDLSKMSENEEVIEVGVDNCSTEKFVEVSTKICDELAKII